MEWLHSFLFCPWLTSSKSSQASLLGAKKVYDPDPSISGLSLEMSEYFWVEVAFTRPKVPYTWSIGATEKEIYNILHSTIKTSGDWKKKKKTTYVDNMLGHPLQPNSIQLFYSCRTWPHITYSVTLNILYLQGNHACLPSSCILGSTRKALSCRQKKQITIVTNN